MTQTLLTILTAGTLVYALCILPATARAEPTVHPENTVGLMSEEVVKQKLEQLGYSQIQDLTQRNGKYEAKAVKNNQAFKLEINALSGDIRATEIKP